jgi:hypothetical protein
MAHLGAVQVLRPKAVDLGAYLRSRIEQALGEVV